MYRHPLLPEWFYECLPCLQPCFTAEPPALFHERWKHLSFQDHAPHYSYQIVFPTIRLSLAEAVHHLLRLFLLLGHIHLEPEISIGSDRNGVFSFSHIHKTVLTKYFGDIAAFVLARLRVVAWENCDKFATTMIRCFSNVRTKASTLAFELSRNFISPRPKILSVCASRLRSSSTIKMKTGFPPA